MQAGFDVNLYPDEINILKNKYMAFMLDIKNYNIKNNCSIYSISKTTTDSKIINDLEEKHNHLQVSQKLCTTIFLLLFSNLFLYLIITNVVFHSIT